MMSKNTQATRLLSPFRYPGGKTWLVPLVRKWLSTIVPKPIEFFEPFAGGAIVGLNIAFDSLAEHVTLVEIDEKVGSVWDTIISQGEGLKLAEKIANFDLTTENVKSLLEAQETTILERAFQTIVHNRVSRGGILAHGAGLLNSGENGKGLISRWYPTTLNKRIRTIHSIRERLLFIQGDGIETIDENKDRTDVAFFLDPPYIAQDGKRAGKRLYAHFEIDYQKLFELAGKIKGQFLITCEDSISIRNMAIKHGFEMKMIPMRNSHHVQMIELLIGRNLVWIENIKDGMVHE